MQKDCGDYLDALKPPVASGMGLILSSWDNRDGSEQIEGWFGQELSDTCDSSVAQIRNFTVNKDDSNEEEGIPIIGDVAPKLDDCRIDSCTACNEAWYSNDPTDTFYQCTGYSRFKYTIQCNNRRNKDLCGPEDLCFWSWPADDAKKGRSDQAACRPLPVSSYEGEFKYSSRTCEETRGLCSLGCGEGTCHRSYPIDDPLKWKSPDNMCRCKDNANN